MSRPQIQEEAVMQLADLLQERVKPDGLAIVMEADHFCMHWRGVKDDESKMTNSVMRGAFLKDADLRREFLSLLPRRPERADACWSDCSTRAAPPSRSTPTRSRRSSSSRRQHNPQVGVTGVLCFCASAHSSCRCSKAAATR